MIPLKVAKTLATGVKAVNAFQTMKSYVKEYDSWDTQDLIDEGNMIADANFKNKYGIVDGMTRNLAIDHVLESRGIRRE